MKWFGGRSRGRHARDSAGGTRREKTGGARDKARRAGRKPKHLAGYREDTYTLSDLEHLVEVRGMPRRKQSQAKFRSVRSLGWPWAALLSAALLSASCLLSFLPAASVRSYEGGGEDSLILDFVGDVMLGRNILALGGSSGYGGLFSHVEGYWEAADLVFANLETAVLSDDVSAYEEDEKEIHLWSTYEGVEAAMEAGVNVWACANNHAFDYSERAVLELTEYFRSEDIAYAGIGDCLEDAARYALIEAGGARIAFLSITDVYYRSALATETQGGVLSTAYRDYNRLVYEASQAADLTVVYIHWGTENGVAVNDRQRTLGRHLADAGADIIIGSHPHVVQEVELYGDSVIFYSLGNFLFDQGNTYARDSVMAEYTLGADGSGAFRLYTVRIEDGVPYVTTSRFYRERINRELSQGLEEGSYFLDEDGFIVIPFTIQESNKEEDGR